MSDESVHSALRSMERLVVVEAPAGCGKTYQGASYAVDAATALDHGRVLVLTHTHAACDVFAKRTGGLGNRVEIRTIDSLICQITNAYHASLDLPKDAAAWARTQDDGFSLLAMKASAMLNHSASVARALANRYPCVICDEHQDASLHQHQLVMALLKHGSSVRIFTDPMQAIYSGKRKRDADEASERWEATKALAGHFERLDYPHRWKDGSLPLGQWILKLRDQLLRGGTIDLSEPRPKGLVVVHADNELKVRGQYRCPKDERRPIDQFANASDSLLVLSTQNATVSAANAFFGRRLRVWEGHVRDHLTALVSGISCSRGNVAELLPCVVAFIRGVSTGFTKTGYSARLVEEATSGCSSKRKGKPAQLQKLARHVLDRPDHRGVSGMLQSLVELIGSDAAFRGIKIDHPREYREAILLGGFDDPEDGLAEITRRRTFSRPLPPKKAISTVHKAKGLECKDVIVFPCDQAHFGDTAAARRLLYVAMSRASRSLLLVAPRHGRSPLLTL